MIVTDNFEVPARQLLESNGYPDVPVIVTPNPVMYLGEAEIRQRVDAIFKDLVKSLCEPSA